MKKQLLFLIILVIPSVLATNDYNNYSEITVRTKMFFDASFDYDSGSSSIDDTSLRTKFFPKNTNFQTITNMDTTANPSAKIKKNEEEISCEWTYPKDRILFTIDTLVNSKNDFIRITNKIDFPPPSFSNDLKEYSIASKNIDLTPEIKQKANDIVEGEIDYLIAITRIAEFTKNYVEYELNLKTEDGVKPSSWVYSNKQGACDEISSLFMAFLRSLGIPVKFVSGIAYSNSKNSFGNHGWTEVYHPKAGWIPFDVTYGQYGWVDPSHIVFMKSLDPGDSSIDYTWTAKGVKLKVTPMEINSSVISIKGKMPSLLDIELKPLKTNVMIGSYTIIRAIVKNNNYYYFPFKAYLSKAPGLVNNDSSRSYIIPPNDKRTFYWIIKSPINLDEDYVYTSIVELKTQFGNTFKTELHYADANEYFSYEWAEKNLEKLQKREDKFSFKNLELDCTPDKNIYYPSETSEITCFIKNTGNTMIKDLNVCLDNKCFEEFLSINELKQINFSHEVLKETTLKATAESSEMIKSSYININTVPIPKAFISDVNPKTIDYKNSSFYISVSTDIQIYNVSLDINRIYQEYIGLITEPKEIPINFESKNLVNKPIFINMTYYDNYGKVYNKYSTTEIEITNIPWYVRLKSFFLDFFNSS